MPDPLAWIDEEAEAWSRRGLERRLVALGGSTPGRVERDGRSLVNFASNDYLGLAADPRVVEAACSAAGRYGWGSGASPLVSGWREPHEALAEALAEFEGAEAVALFPSGFAANLGAIVALVGPGDAVYLDRLDHACLIDGARLSGARLRVYPARRRRTGSESILARDRGRFRRSLIATDGVFSMDGDLAPLADLADLAGRFGAILLVDEAHGTGVLGARGPGGGGGVRAWRSGSTSRSARSPRRWGRSAGSWPGRGGWSTGWSTTRGRMIYSTAPAARRPPPRRCRALEIARDEPWRRSRLLELARTLREAAGRAARVGPGGPIVPVVRRRPGAGPSSWPSRLLDRGCLVPAIRPPTVPEGTARLRVSLTAAHGRADVDRLIAALAEVRCRRSGSARSAD